VGGVLHNGGTLENSGFISNSGTLENDGIIRNIGTIDNQGTISNSGTIYSSSQIGGTITGNTPIFAGEIHGMKFNDLNGNGIKDLGEIGLANWTIRLKNESGSVVSTITDTSGNYSFTNLIDDNYTIGEVLKSEEDKHETV